jgi:hypothetical protein
MIASSNEQTVAASFSGAGGSVLEGECDSDSSCGI